MFDIEIPTSSVTKSIEKQPHQIESILPKKLNNEMTNTGKDGKDSTLPSSTFDGNANGNGALKSTLSVKSHVM